MKLTDKIRRDYLQKFNFLFLSGPEVYAELDKIIEKMQANKARYEEVALVSNCPWWFVATLHQMESSLDFSKHLHNGDSLRERTVNVPAGRPSEGQPPFTWEESAYDALQARKFSITNSTPIEFVLFELEKYNGLGYRSINVSSPYLWGRTNHHTSGKFTRDGVFDHTAKTSQIGAAAIVRRFTELGEYDPFSNTQRVKEEVPLIVFDEVTSRRDVQQLQIFLNKVSPLKLRVDGVAGRRTARSFFLVFRMNLPGAPNDLHSA